MNLSDVFSAVAYKKLVAVDLPHLGSHQHELNGSRSFKPFFQTDNSIKLPSKWFYFADDRDTLTDSGSLTFYDARASGRERTGRSPEWHLYYTGSFLQIASPGDMLVLARLSESGPDDTVYALVFQQNSGWLRSATVLFGLDQSSGVIELLLPDELDEQNLEFAQQRILEELGIDVELPVVKGDLDLVLDQFGDAFPSTRAMSDFARSLVDVNPRLADEALSRWIEREEQLFRAREAMEVEVRIRKGFSEVEEFISYSLSVQNRRKSRMGHALQNHLDALFASHHLRFQTQKTTEGKNKPDFLFPGQKEYLDGIYDPNLLNMLAAKSTCKDRWRQILTEADRITLKHLCTLESGISTDQTEDMRIKNVTLVLPATLHGTYTSAQREFILTVTEFITAIRSKQNSLHATQSSLII